MHGLVVWLTLSRLSMPAEDKNTVSSYSDPKILSPPSLMSTLKSLAFMYLSDFGQDLVGFATVCHDHG